MTSTFGPDNYARLKQMVGITRSQPRSMTMTGSIGELACLFIGFDAASELSLLDEFHSWLEARFLYRTEYGFIYYAWREVFPDRSHENFLHLPQVDQDLIFTKVLELAEAFADDRISEQAG